jgi:pimeloyl-ACP methyl ester carboxylesterase
MYPFPCDFYLEEDPSTATRRHIAFPAEALPAGLEPDTWERVDGFSRIPAILAALAGGVDPDSLPDPADPGAALDPDSTVMLVREDTWEPVPILAEMDRQTPVVAHQALILRPHLALEPNTRYVVLLRDGLERADGGAHHPTEAFRALRDGIATDSEAVEAQREDFELVNEAIAGLDLEPEEVVLGWSFQTRSREQLATPLLAMHDAMMAATLPTWTPTSDEVDGDSRLIEGQITVPDFLDEDNRIQLDGAGLPIQQGTREFPFLITLPETVEEPRPVVLFGHGFFSTREEPTWSSLNRALQQWEMTAVSTDFMGFDEPSWGVTASAVGGDLAALEGIVAQQIQSQAHFTALARLVSEQLAQDIVEDRGAGAFHPLDGEAVHYMGISNGGTQGAVLLATSPALSRGALVVGGGGWSHMLQRAVQWTTLGFILENAYDDPLELQLVMSIMQLTFDPVDAMSHADRLVHERYPDRPPVEVTLHEAVGDCQVNNMVTHWVARSAGVPLVVPSPLEVWGLDTITAMPPDGADSSAALLIYDEGYPPLPEGNIPPEEDNGAHDTIRDLPAYLEQVGTFLETGTIVQVCEGACDPD